MLRRGEEATPESLDTFTASGIKYILCRQGDVSVPLDTTNQLQLFAKNVLKGVFANEQIDEASFTDFAFKTRSNVNPLKFRDRNNLGSQH